VGQAFRAVNPNVKLFGVEPDESCTIQCGETGMHAIEGIADGFVPGIIARHKGVIDGFIPIESVQAIAEIRGLARDYGLFVGPSSGAHLIAARQLKRDHPEFRTIVTLFCDEGEKYISEHFSADAADEATREARRGPEAIQHRPSGKEEDRS
jgi:cysteine synthase A